ncbi:MAG TPA: T9SS type A sorting domain-containing protein, partial [Chitinophagales bacterium]|nr:T9SS type A sorting domain-containing protein [Chitinophagales bacterium]
IRLWPGKGNPHILSEYGINITRNLAPFTDVNGNNIYDPANGDYPAFCGDQAIFFVYNNERGSHVYTTSSNSMGIEIRALAEQFLLDGEPLDKNPVNNAIFVHYELDNLSAESYSDFHVAMKADPDLGCYTNDAVGCDTNNNLAYGYNRVLFDNNCQGLTGYHNLKIAAGLKLLNRQLSSFNMDKPNMLFEDDNSDSTYYYYTLRGMWPDGLPYTEGGYGRGGTTPTKYVFPGTPTDTSAWSEVTANTQMGDRWMYASSGPEVFIQGQVKTLDYAFFASYDSTATNLTIVDSLRRDADIIQSFYSSTVVPCRAAIGTGITKADDRLLQVSVYPNPASSQLEIETPGAIARLQLSNMLGQVVLALPGTSSKQVIDVSGLAKGIYLLNVKAGSKEAVQKVVIE